MLTKDWTAEFELAYRTLFVFLWENNGQCNFDQYPHGRGTVGGTPCLIWKRYEHRRVMPLLLSSRGNSLSRVCRIVTRRSPSKSSAATIDQPKMASGYVSVMSLWIDAEPFVERIKAMVAGLQKNLLRSLWTPLKSLPLATTPTMYCKWYFLIDRKWFQI